MSKDAQDLPLLDDQLFEIIEVSDQEVVLQTADDADEPLVRISFSSGAQRLWRQDPFKVALEMLDTAMQRGEMWGPGEAPWLQGETEEDLSAKREAPPILH
ncbi:hypothetical protein BFW38_04685 [Terasakiispira papahanaumokuakeensis]|uniref:Uncharacterized protein n=1 Tax=Terasakiispira papahanaumokuakeensis TaxID=197479 RepID=A0A1E2V7F4_9GAMM|nr:hypothetical protein [Terasakiispira papahanaumokuakeensis]ODC02948.1 hypothetical protein BFW38_04685 [Terasakiispira papahanaumokuakeensis]